MATIVLTIPDDQQRRVIDALCARPMMMQMIVPASTDPSAEEARQIIIDWVTANVVAYEAEQARKALSAPAVDNLIS